MLVIISQNRRPSPIAQKNLLLQNLLSTGPQKLAHQSIGHSKTRREPLIKTPRLERALELVIQVHLEASDTIPNTQLFGISLHHLLERQGLRPTLNDPKVVAFDGQCAKVLVPKVHD